LSAIANGGPFTWKLAYQGASLSELENASTHESNIIAAFAGARLSPLKGQASSAGQAPPEGPGLKYTPKDNRIGVKGGFSYGPSKVGHLLKHRDVLGYGDISYQQAQKMIPQLEAAANNLFSRMKLERVGQWSGFENAKFYIGEGKMLVTQQDGTFITTINKTSNAWFKKAKPIN
jgi:hypothetical protein